MNAEGIARIVEQAIPQIAFGLRPDVLDGLEGALDGLEAALDGAEGASVGGEAALDGAEDALSGPGDALHGLEDARTRSRACGQASREREQGIIQQLVDNARIANDKQVPLCQDTGYVWVFLEVGEKDSQGWEIMIPADIFSQVDGAVARAYQRGALRLSLVRDALIDRVNTQDNTPAFCELYLNPHITGATLHVMLKGGGSDNASRVVMLPPGEGIPGVRQVVNQAVAEKGANACPPLIIGVGVGSTFDKVAGLAKRALLRPVGTENPNPQLATLEQQMLADINNLGIGAGGFGGATTALAVHILTAPCHIAALPVAVNIGCNAMRSISVDLEKSHVSKTQGGDA